MTKFGEKRIAPRKRINPTSQKQRQRIKDWYNTCMVKRNHQISERGWVYCEICGKPESLARVWGHHIIPKSQGGKDNYDNCELAHFIPCHMNKYHGGNYYTGEGRLER